MATNGPTKLPNHSAQQGQLFRPHECALQQSLHLGHARSGGVLQQKTRFQQQILGIAKTGIELRWFSGFNLLLCWWRWPSTMRLWCA